MTTILANIQQFLDSDNTNGAREEVAKTLTNLKAVNPSIRDFAALLALGSQKALEIGLGVLGRELLKKDLEVKIDVIWLLLAAVLSRQNITPDSPSRISILGLTSCVENWKSPIFALLTPALDSFLKVSLSEGTPLIAEQTIDFIVTWGDSYAQAPRTKKQLNELNFLTQSVLKKVDNWDIKSEWAEGLNTFFKTALTQHYSDENIWSSASNLLKNIYTPQILNYNRSSNESSRVKDNILRLITSCLAALGTILGGDGLSVAVHIDNPENNNFWSVVASAIDKLERLFQEVADVTFNRITTLPKFTPAQAIPGSWTIILHINLNSDQSTSLARAISSLSSTEYRENEINSSLADSWQDCVTGLKQDDIRVDIAVSTNVRELHIVRAISTEDDIEILNFEESVQPNIRVLSRDVPQADSLERVLDFASLLIEYPASLSAVRQKFLDIGGITDRQFSFYRRSVEILGLADERGRPTTACSILNRLSGEPQMRFLAYQFISSNVGAAWFNWQKANDLSEIQPQTATAFLIEVCPSLSEATVKRRARTLESWLHIFLKYWK